MIEKQNPNQLTFGTEFAAPQSRSIKPETQQLMRLMLEMDINKDALASILDLAEFNIQHVRYMAGPVIVHRCSWSEALPPWLVKACLLERLDRIEEEHDAGQVGNLATNAEILACMYPASMEAPMHREWVDLYLWLGNDVMTRHNRLSTGQNFWELLDKDCPPKFEQLKSSHSQIARDIRRKVVEEGKRRGWGQRKKRAISVSNNTNSDNTKVLLDHNPSKLDIVQLSLFS